MINIDQAIIENEIIKQVEDIKNNFNIQTDVDIDSCPGLIAGITSQILVTVISRLQPALGIIIPNNTYIFHNKEKNKQLTIKEAAQKLIKVAKNGIK